jgi:hypothetical protein
VAHAARGEDQGIDAVRSEPAPIPQLQPQHCSSARRTSHAQLRKKAWHLIADGEGKAQVGATTPEDDRLLLAAVW